MPTTLQKTRKAIAKKRNGDVTTLHEKSRNSFRLRKADVRDQRLGRLAATRTKKERPIVDRVCYFQDAVLEQDSEPLTVPVIQELITTLINQCNEEFDEIKKTRRSGRPPSVKEDLLKLKISNLNTEYEQGFYLPDVTTEENVKRLAQWDGSWTQLSSLQWIKLTSDGQTRTAEHPTKGLN